MLTPALLVEVLEGSAELLDAFGSMPVTRFTSTWVVGPAAPVHVFVDETKYTGSKTPDDTNAQLCAKVE